MVDDAGDVWTVVDRGGSRTRVSHGTRRELSGPRYFSKYSFGESEDHEPEIALAMCVVEPDPMSNDVMDKTVRFDPDDFIGKECTRPSQGGKPAEIGPAYYRRCVAARVAARQKALDLAGAVESFKGNHDRKLINYGSILNDDRRTPILWVTTEIGLKYDCYSAFLTGFEDYQPVLDIDYRYMRDASCFYPGIK